jgi:carboxylesterase type B
MKFLITALQGLGLLAATVAAAPTAESHPEASPELEERANVNVDSPAGSVQGLSLLGVESFRGIPYAEPPVGQLRLKPPKRLTTGLSNFDARGIAPACPQMFISSETEGILGGILDLLLDVPFLKPLTGQEDCLSISVQRPAGTKSDAKLPVLFWIFGGGFQLGATNTYDATDLLRRGIDQKQPFIFVAVNYRVAGFGFLPGAEILADGSANLGLLDQRMGLEWVADNIAAFGGDPDKVTIWGESAGAISVFDQMALYGGNATYKEKQLFRGAIMNSGSIVPSDPVDCPKGQAVYDSVVERSGCAGSDDTLACLREVDYDTFLDAVNAEPGILSYSSVALSYLPRPDGHVLPESPDVLVKNGQYHAVPMIIGDQEDEGTLFALFQTNLTRTNDIVDYLSKLFFHSASKEELTVLVETYPSAWSAGSPFRTGILNSFYSSYKRLAAILGDLVFTLTRRVFLADTLAVNPDVPSWSYLASYNHGTPLMGTFHASDLLQVFYGQWPNNAMRSCRAYYFNFLYNLDPNVGVTDYAHWPQWKENKDLMWFETGNRNSILKDDFRDASAKWIADNVPALYI